MKQLLTGRQQQKPECSDVARFWLYVRRFLISAALLIVAVTSHALPTLDETCTVNVLNRTVQVQADGSWTLPNVPSNMGQRQ